MGPGGQRERGRGEAELGYSRLGQKGGSEGAGPQGVGQALLSTKLREGERVGLRAKTREETDVHFFPFPFFQSLLQNHFQK